MQTKLQTAVTSTYHIVMGTSLLVSALSILEVAVYQLITIQVDPFGIRHIITSPRCIATCLLTWLFATGWSCISKLAVDEPYSTFIVAVAISVTVIATGICYFLIYRAVAQPPVGTRISPERVAENKRLVRTFGMVYGTTFCAWVCIATVMFPLIGLNVTVETSPCFWTLMQRVTELIYVTNWVANSFIHWWRLKEFRTVIPSCRRRNFRTTSSKVRPAGITQPSRKDGTHTVGDDHGVVAIATISWVFPIVLSKL